MTSINGGANATILEGSVHDSTGQPVAGAMITVKTARLNATTISTYTANNGEFTFPYLEIVKIPAWDIKMQKVGYLQSGMPAIKTRGQRQIVSIRAQHIDNVATQVPPSAWLANIPDTPAGHSVVLQCSQCHQFPFAKVKNYIQKFSMLPDSEREKVWLDVMKFMRVKMTTLGPKNKADRNAITAQLPLETFANDSFSAWSHTDESDMAPVLTKYMPTRFDSYSLSDYEKLLSPVGGPGTIIREYQMPDPAESMFHDSVVVRKAGGGVYHYVLDWTNPRMVRLNPATGEIRMFPLPKGLVGEHTLVPDYDGNLWATFQASGNIARFDIASETWKAWNTDSAGGHAVRAGSSPGLVHSLAFKAGFELGFDVNGCVWASLQGTNQVVRLDPKSGETSIFDAPNTGDSPFVTNVYGAVMAMDGKKVWFTQLTGYLFSVNVDTGVIEDKIVIPRGAGPRRLTIDKNDVLYVPMYGAGSLFVYDTKAKKEVGWYPMPDRAATPYSAMWDGYRNAVWTGGGNSAKIYKFDVTSKSWTEYPLPTRNGVIMRSIPIDQKTGDVYFSYAPVASLKGPNMLGWLHPDDAEVIKKP